MIQTWGLVEREEEETMKQLKSADVRLMEFMPVFHSSSERIDKHYEWPKDIKHREWIPKYDFMSDATTFATLVRCAYRDIAIWFERIHLGGAVSKPLSPDGFWAVPGVLKPSEDLLNSRLSRECRYLAFDMLDVFEPAGTMTRFLATIPAAFTAFCTNVVPISGGLRVTFACAHKSVMSAMYVAGLLREHGYSVVYDTDKKAVSNFQLDVNAQSCDAFVRSACQYIRLDDELSVFPFQAQDGKWGEKSTDDCVMVYSKRTERDTSTDEVKMRGCCEPECGKCEEPGVSVNYDSVSTCPHCGVTNYVFFPSNQLRRDEVDLR